MLNRKILNINITLFKYWTALNSGYRVSVVGTTNVPPAFNKLPLKIKNRNDRRPEIRILGCIGETTRASHEGFSLI
jgi:hypothetical protein